MLSSSDKAVQGTMKTEYLLLGTFTYIIIDYLPSFFIDLFAGFCIIVIIDRVSEAIWKFKYFKKGWKIRVKGRRLNYQAMTNL